MEPRREQSPRRRRSRNEADQRLAAQHADILSSVEDSVIVTDLEGRITHWSDGAKTLFGYDAAEMVGRTPAALYPDEDPAALARDLVRVLAGEDVTGLWRGRRRDGQTVWVDIKTAVLRGTRGTPIGFIGIGRDVTIRHEAERARAELERRNRLYAEQLRALSEAALAVHGAGDVAAIVREVTRRARVVLAADLAITRLTSPEPSEGGFGAIQAVDPEVAYDETAPPHRAAPELGRLSAPVLERSGRRLGSIEVLRSRKHAFSPNDEDVLTQLARMAAAALDNARLVELLREEKRRAEQASGAKDRFLAVLGHELRNPLAPILSALELARRRGGFMTERDLRAAERQTHYLLRLVDDLLDIARIEQGKLTLSFAPVSLADVVEQAIETVTPQVHGRRQHLDLHQASEPLVVSGDLLRLSQIMINLLSNASKYSPPETTIDVTVRTVGDDAEIVVRDRGIGIDPALLPHVFDPFVQGNRILDHARGGLGLGLAIVKRLAELHGGAIEARSEGRGHGSEFRLRLPRPPVARRQAAPAGTDARRREAAG